MAAKLDKFQKDILIKEAKRNKAKMLTKRIMEYKNISINEAFELLSNSMTYDLLMQTFTELYGSTDELLWEMIKAEMDNNMTWFEHLICDRQ